MSVASLRLAGRFDGFLALTVLVFSALNLGLLRHRLAVEAAALAERRLEAGRAVG